MDNLEKILGWCIICKNPITIDDDYVKDKGKLYCSFCYKQINNIVEELDFDK